MATEHRLAGLSWSAGCFFVFQTSATSFSTDCNFRLVSLISSPNALAANSDPVCSFFFWHIDTSSAVTTNLCRPSCPAPLSVLSLACLSTGGLVLRDGKPSDSRAACPCSPQSARAELDRDTEREHFCIWISSCRRAGAVCGVTYTKAVQASFRHLPKCSGAPADLLLNDHRVLGTLNLPGCGDQQVLSSFHVDLSPLQTNEVVSNSVVHVAAVELMGFVGSRLFKADRFVLIITRPT